MAFRREFRSGPVKKRSFLTKLKRDAIRRRRFGPKFQIGDSLIKKLLTVNVPDEKDTTFLAERRRQRTVKKTFTLDQIIQSTIATKTNIELKILAMRDLLQKGVLNVDEQNALVVLLKDIFEQTDENIINMTDRQFVTIKTALNQIDLGINPLAWDIRSAIVRKPGYDSQRALILMFIYANFDRITMRDMPGQSVEGALSIRTPIYQLVSIRIDGTNVIAPTRLTAIEFNFTRGGHLNLNWLMVVRQNMTVDEDGRLGAEIGQLPFGGEEGEEEEEEEGEFEELGELEEGEFEEEEGEVGQQPRGRFRLTIPPVLRGDPETLKARQFPITGPQRRPVLGFRRIKTRTKGTRKRGQIIQLKPVPGPRLLPQEPLFRRPVILRPLIPGPAPPEPPERPPRRFRIPPVILPEVFRL